MTDRYSGTRIVGVGIKDRLTATNIKYAFRTTLSAAKGADLGHVVAADANGVLLPGFIIGANSPKPPRASKKRPTGETDSSFIDYASIAGAPAKGWKIEPGTIMFPRATRVSIPVFVEVYAGAGEAGAKYNYGWRMPKFQYDLIAPDFPILGITEVTQGNYGEVWFGVNKPKPFRAAQDLSVDSTMSTFVSSSKLETLMSRTLEGGEVTTTGWYVQGQKKGDRGTFGI